MNYLKAIKWIFWLVVYRFRRRPGTLHEALIWLERTRSPWWKFKPYLWRSNLGQIWQAVLKDSRCYAVSRLELSVTVEFDIETGEVCSVKFYDRALKELEEEESVRREAYLKEWAEKMEPAR